MHYSQQTDKSVYTIPYQSAVEVYKLPLGSHKNNDLDVELYHQDGKPVFKPGETRTLKVCFKNHENIPQIFDVEADVPGFKAESVHVEVPAEGRAECTLTLTAPVKKEIAYRGHLRLKRIVNGMFWDYEEMPLTILPSMDWRMCVDGVETEIGVAENRLSASELGIKDAKTLAFSTRFTLTDKPSTVWLKFCCRNPLKVELDGKTVIDTPDYTVVIPAYHRADNRKCTYTDLTPGAHDIKITVGDVESFKELYFMPVAEKEVYWAYRIDTLFE